MFIIDATSYEMNYFPHANFVRILFSASFQLLTHLGQSYNSEPTCGIRRNLQLSSILTISLVAYT